MPPSHEPSYVIALSGPSGAGKSTLIDALSSRLKSVVTLRMDDYDHTSTYPDITHWLAAGADPNAFATPQFATDIHALRTGAAIIPPHSAVALQPARYLLIEEPFGRRRDQLRALIDFVVYIDVPLDIALARKILRRNAFLPWDHDPDVFIRHLQSFLAWYLQVGSTFSRTLREQVIPECDLVLDGTRPTEELVEAIVRAVPAKHDLP